MAGALIRGGNIIAHVEVSAKVSECHNFTSTATENPIQDGSIISDHVILKPVVLDYVFTSSNAQNNGQPPQAVFDAFFKYWQTRELLTVYTEHKIHDNMVITGFTPTHQAPNKGALSCTLRLQQIKPVNLSTVKYANAMIPAAAQEINRGKVAPKAVGDSKVGSLMSSYPPPVKR